MIGDISQSLWLYSVGIFLVFIIGLYCLLATYNLIRAVIGIELMIKAVTLFIILAGRITARTGLAQAFAITLIVIEVVIMVVAMGVIINAFKHNKNIDVRSLRHLKG
jgi:NADH:ubiquinone oxidoreductase subunit K